MADKKDNLKKLLQLIDEISKGKGNEWFKEELINLYSKNNGHGFSNADDIIDDLRRTKEYLTKIDRKAHLEGFTFYKNVKDRNLRKELVSDYKEMKIAFLNSDILEYGRRMNLQLEKCFDAAITCINGWEIVKNNSKYYEVSITMGTFTQKIRVTDSFYRFDYQDKTKKVPKELSEIEYKAKAIFCSIYYQINFEKYWSSLLDIYFIRNKASHGLLSTKDLAKLNNIIEKFPEKNGYYHKMFCSFILPLKDILFI